MIVRLQASLLALVAAATLTSCEAIGQMNLIPVEQDPQLGAEAYPQLLSDSATIGSGADYEMVTRMTDNLVGAAKELDPDIANAFEWEVRLVRDDNTANAWCLPGGKMAVYTGILPIAQGETGLAVVMGHEIAHATLRHGTRAMTRQMGASAIVAIVAGVAGDGEGGQLATLGSALGANLANLSFGRDAELEADRRGLMYMAKAGYDPREAVGFWQRMQAASGGGGGGALEKYFSTHPSNERRIQQIESLLPEVIPVYEESRGSNGPKPGERKKLGRR